MGVAAVVPARARAGANQASPVSPRPIQVPAPFTPAPAPRWNIGGMPLRPKLAIGAVDDPQEAEADRIADQVMRMPDPVATAADTNRPRGPEGRSRSSAGAKTVRRACATCEEDEKVRKKPDSAATRGAGEAPPSVHAALAQPGAGLDGSLRQFFEPRFGHDLRQVQLHRTDAAAESAKDIGALAYTAGSQIVFAKGQYDPGSLTGRRLLAHELAHVVQSDRMQNDGAASLRRFGSEEHVRIGDTVEPGQGFNLDNVGTITFGEMIALGDYFESVSQISQLAQDPLFGALEVQVALWKVNPASRTRPLVGQNVEDAVMARYYDLASKNQTHFSMGSETGKSNREQYISMHQTAISNAFSQGNNGIIQGVSWQGWEAFAQHFLTDAFSAGHVRTPRHEIQAYWNGKYPNFRQNLVNMISCYMAAYIHDRDTVGLVTSVDYLADNIKPILLQKAGNVLNAFAFGDLISKLLHDSDSKGLEVKSQAGVAPGSGPLTWRDVGDEHLFGIPAAEKAQMDPAQVQQMEAAQQQTQAMVSEAVRRSFGEVQSAFNAGQKRTGDLNAMMDSSGFSALPLIPVADNAAGNPTFDWKGSADIPQLGPAMKAMLIGAFAPGQEIGDQLRNMSVDCITPKFVLYDQIEFDLHTWEAWVCFRNTLLGDVIGTLDRISQGDTCPPGQNNPCGKITTPCP